MVRRPGTVGIVILLAALAAFAVITGAPRGVVVAGPLPMRLAPGPPLAEGGEGGDASSQLLATPTGAQATVPILLYHYIRVDNHPRDTLGIALSVTPTLFAEQMEVLHAEGGHPITLATLISAMTNHMPLPPHPVVLTFDDGYADFAGVAEPILALYHFVATDYVVSGFLTRPGFLDAAMIKQMDAAGMVIGSHTVNHVDLAHLPLPVAKAQIDGGKAALEAVLGHPVLDFAYPYGGFSAPVVQLVQQAGFRDAVTTEGGSVQSLGQRFLLRRTELGGVHQGLDYFATAARIPPPDAAQVAQANLAALQEVGVQPPQPSPIPTAPPLSAVAAMAPAIRLHP